MTREGVRKGGGGAVKSLNCRFEKAGAHATRVQFLQQFELKTLTGWLAVHGMTYCQRTIGLKTKGRGVYDVTSSVEGIKEIGTVKIGLCHVFIKHTSASITLSKRNAEDDMEHQLFSEMVPESDDYVHCYEGLGFASERRSIV